jgi:hypothetical protein
MAKTVQIVIGANTYDVEEMDLEQLELFLNAQKPLMEPGAQIEQRISVLTECLKVALMRAAPEIKEAEIKRALTWNGMMEAMKLAREASGLVQAPVGETQEAETGTGPASTQTSSMEPDGTSTISEG